MVVLGLLARHGPQHGYQLRKLMESQNIDRFSNVQLGSIYATLKRLIREGFAEAQATETSPGRGPARTVHAITGAGRVELEELITHSFTALEQPERPVDLALHFSSLMPRRTVVELLGRRLQSLTDHQRRLEELLANTTHPEAGVQELIRDIGAHFAAFNSAEREWTARVLDCARQGGYRVPQRATV